jgi:hypothetical protein
VLYRDIDDEPVDEDEDNKIEEEEINAALKTCQNLQNKLLNFTVLFIWYLLASLKKMSLAMFGELYFILASTCFSPLTILASV